jgi:hypothetical protein
MNGNLFGNQKKVAFSNQYQGEYSMDYLKNKLPVGIQSIHDSNRSVSHMRNANRHHSFIFDSHHEKIIKRDLTPGFTNRDNSIQLPKAGGVNDWGIVLKHNDELDQEAQRQELIRQRKQKEEYRIALETQIQNQLYK